MTENEISKTIVQTCYDVHVQPGPGLLESVYEEILNMELLDHGLNAEKQKGIPVSWKENKLNLGFRADLIVEKKFIVELKSVKQIAPVQQTTSNLFKNSWFEIRIINQL